MYICIHTKNIKYDMLKAFMRSNLSFKLSVTY